jgi:3-phenylpropionate/cinnamic acid dioxygenase small subunit
MEFEDYLQIRNLIYRYADLVDQGKFSEVGHLFAHADFLGPGVGPIRSDPVAVAANYQRWVRIYPDSGTPKTRHVTSNVIIESESPTVAHAQSNVIVFQGTADLKLQPIVASSYRDRFARVDGVWRFSERRIGLEVPDVIGDLSAHLTHTDHLTSSARK